MEAMSFLASKSLRGFGALGLELGLKEFQNFLGFKIFCRIL